MIRHESDYERLNEKLKSEKGKTILTLRNADVIVAENIEIGVDSTSWYEEHDSRKKTIKTSEIEKFTFTNHEKGCTAGKWYGFSTIVALIAVGYLNNQEKRDRDQDYAKFSAIMLPFSVIVFGLLGFWLGGLIGYAIGGKDEYIFEEDKHIPNIEVEPPILQSDGFYKINVSSINWEKQEIIVTWHGKKIHLQKSELKQSWKSGDKSYIIIPSEIYERDFKEE